MEPVHIAVLGAGPGGVRTLHELVRTLGKTRRNITITLVSNTDAHFYNPAAPRGLASGNPRALLWPVAPLAGGIARVLVATVVQVHARHALVAPAPGHSSLTWHGTLADLPRNEDGKHHRLDFDYCVLALGSSAAFPGKAPTTWSADQVAHRLEHAQQQLKHARRIVILGSGVSAVEMACELRFAHPAADITLVGPAISSNVSSGYTKQLQHAVAAKGIKHIAARADPAAVLKAAAADEFPVFAPSVPVALDSGEQVHADAVLCAVGLRANTGPLAALGPAADGVAVDTYLRVQERIFAVGDIVAASPKRMAVALLQAPVVAHNVAALVNGGGTAKLRPFIPPNFAMEFAALGPDMGAGAFPLLGSRFAAWVAKKFKGKDGGESMPKTMKLFPKSMAEV